jgi:hypothetical protein
MHRAVYTQQDMLITVNSSNSEVALMFIHKWSWKQTHLRCTKSNIRVYKAAIGDVNNSLYYRG